MIAWNEGERELVICRLLVALALTGLLAPCARAECRPTGNTSLAGYPRNFLDDVGALPCSENGTWLLAGAALTGLALALEDPDGPNLSLGSSLTTGLSEFSHVWGHGRFWAPMSAGLWVAGSLRDDSAMADLGYDLARSLLLTTMVTWGTKSLADRTRPSGGPWSFPSGHTAVAFTVAGVTTRRCGGWVGVAALGCGVATGLGRLIEGKHYPSDVLAGATIGWIIGRTAARREDPADTAWRLAPLPGGVAVTTGF